MASEERDYLAPLLAALRAQRVADEGRRVVAEAEAYLSGAQRHLSRPEGVGPVVNATNVIRGRQIAKNQGEA